MQLLKISIPSLFILSVIVFRIVVIPSIAASSSIPGNATFTSFTQVKNILLAKVYYDHHTEFYCDNPFDAKKHVISDPHKYSPKKNSKRAQSIEWEHIVPAEAFGQSFAEWRNGSASCLSKGKPYKGRKCADKASLTYRYMQSDMYNLVPAIGELNGLRSNYSYAMIDGEARTFGVCDFEIKDKKAEPMPKIWGDIARTYFYMDAVYPGRGIISGKNLNLFQAWDRSDPVTQWECTRAKRIEILQKNANPFVKIPCQKQNFWK